MARSLYVPIHVHARLVVPGGDRPATVDLSQGPCEPATGPALAPGVHLHWALPDALTRGRVEGSDLRYPAVPDRWIVVRYASAATYSLDDGDGPAPPLRPARKTRAFVVDAKLGASGRIGSLSFEPSRESRWLTALGLFAEGLVPGTKGSLPASRHLEHAYYPTAGGRFGFHDPLTDLHDAPAPDLEIFRKYKDLDRLDWSALRLSYVVIGHYSDAGEDPLARAADDGARLAWLDEVRLHLDLPLLVFFLPAPVHAEPIKAERPLAGKALQAALGGRLTDLGDLRQRVKLLPETDTLRQTIAATTKLAEQSAAAVAALQNLGIAQATAIAGPPEDDSGVPSRLVCHGAVIDIGPSGEYQKNDGQRVVSQWTSIADSASAAIEQAFRSLGGDELFAILRGGLDGEIDSTAGKQSIAHLLHAAGFDSAPDDVADAEEFVALVEDFATGGTSLAPPAQASLRIVDRRRTGARLPSYVTGAELGALRDQVKPAVVRVETRKIARPRWHRPATPVLRFDGHGRNFRHGADGRMRSDGKLQCRAGGQTVTALTLTLPDYQSPTSRLTGPRLVELDPALRLEPEFVRALVHETALLDSSNAARAAELWAFGVAPRDDAGTGEAVRAAFRATTQKWWTGSDPAAGQTDAPGKYAGTLPAPLAVTPWRDPWLPLFAEFKYSFTPDLKDSSPGLRLDPVDVAVAAAPLAETITGSSRQPLASALPATLQSAIARVREHLGKVPARKAELDELVARLAALDTLTVGFDELDPALRARGYAFRSGKLTVTALRLVDGFGTVRELPGPSNWPLPPRLTHWSRVQTRLIDAAGADAGRNASPVCGFLLFDAVEQALELFAPDGAPLGQLRHDRAAPAQTGKWESAPGRTGVLLPAIEPAILRDLATALLAGPAPLPNSSGTTESALAAALRVLDRARFSVARRLPSDDHRAALCGRPVVVLRARLTLELAGLGASDRPVPNDPNAHEPDRVRVLLGSLEQSNDGLLAVFRRQGDAWKLQPVPCIRDAVWKSPYAVTHPLIEREPTFDLVPGVPVDVYLLLDGASSFHVQTGLLPRKRIDVAELVPQHALAKILPTLRVGPLLFAAHDPRVPAPQLPGNVWTWLEGQDPAALTAARAAAFAPAQSELPDDRATVHEGWLRLDVET